MTQNITEDEVKNYQELIEIGNEENKPDPDKLNQLLSHSKKFPKNLKKLKIGKTAISIILPLFFIFIIVYILVKNVFGYGAKFKLIKVKNKQEIGKAAGDIIIELLQTNSNPKITLSTGRLPKSIYKYLIDQYQDKQISFINTTFFNLDEYCGLHSDSKLSHCYYINDNLLDHIDIDKKKLNLIKGYEEGDSCEGEAERYNSLLNQNEIDLNIISIEDDKKLGLNEPGTSFDSKTHIIKLSQQKKEELAELFDYKIGDIPSYGISQGIDNILKSKKILVVASGKDKAQGVKNLIKGNADKDIPITALKNHLGDIYVVADEDACTLI